MVPDALTPMTSRTTVRPSRGGHNDADSDVMVHVANDPEQVIDPSAAHTSGTQGGCSDDVWAWAGSTTLLTTGVFHATPAMVTPAATRLAI